MSESYTIQENKLYLHDFKDRFDYWTSQEWREQIEVLVIDDGVAEIPDGAFQYFERLREVHLPSSLKRIGDSAFSACQALEKIS